MSGTIHQIVRNLREIAWPDVATEKGRQFAITVGAAALAWTAGAYAINAIQILFYGHSVKMENLDSAWRYTNLGMLAVFAAVGFWLAVWLIEKKSALAARVGLTWIGLEALLKPWSGHESRMVSVILIFAAIHGVRATQAQHSN